LIASSDVVRSSRDALRFFADSVSAGTRPSGGSTSSEARLRPSTVVKREPGSSQKLL